ncbi:MAG: S9 family peptidase [Gammaproteobacteria bacterium]|nr:MAG: S9 family peptidase [Gammaproteobacteria bacterium]
MFHLTASGTAGRSCAGSMNEHVAAVGCSVATILLCGMLAKPAAAQGAPVTAVLDTLSSVHPFGEVAISPDARRVVYGSVVTGKRAGAEVDVSALWIAQASDGSGAARLTACPGSVCDEHSAAWSPDGTQVAFVTTDAKEQTQIAIATASDRNVKIITRAHGPLDTPRWSSDGSRIAFLYSEGAPKTPGPLNPLARDAGVLSSTVYEQRLALISAHGGNATLLGPADLNIYEYDWSPDGKRFAITAARGSGDDNWWIAELDLLDAQSGALTTLVRPHLQIASPRWSGDGTRIAYIGGLMSDQGITGGDIYVVPAAGGAPVDATAGLAGSVQTITWNASATRILATEFAAGDAVLATIDVDSKSRRELWRAPQMIWANCLLGFTPGDAGISLSRNAALSAVIRQSYTSPPEVATGPPGKWEPITRANAGVKPITGKASNVFWKSDSFSVQGMLIEPPSVVQARRYPLVVVVHGGPAYAHYPLFPASPDSFDAVLASQGYFVFKPNPRGSYGQGEAFTQANVKDFGYGDLRDILSGVDAAQKTAPIDPERVGITGWSYGGYMTMWALTQTDRFKAAVAGAGLSDWLSYYGTNNIDTWMIPYFGASVYDDPNVYARSSPMTFIKNVHAPTLIVGGDRDAEVPITQSYEYWNALRRLGVRTEFVVYPDEGHFFFRRADQVDVASRVVNWFNAYLKPGP